MFQASSMLAVSWSTEGDLWRTIICGEFLDPRIMVMVQQIFVYTYVFMSFHSKSTKTKISPILLPFFWGGQLFLLFSRMASIHHVLRPEKIWGKSLRPLRLQRRLQRMEDEDCGDIFHQDQKMYRFFLRVLLGFFRRRKRWTKNLEDGRFLGWSEIACVFWGDIYIYNMYIYNIYIYICLRYIFIISELKFNSLFQDDLWFGSNFGPECFCFSLMSPWQATFFVKNLRWTSKTHLFWASTQSPWMSRLAKFRWSFAKKAWCCEKTKRACEAQLWRRVGELYFPVVLAWKYEGSYVFIPCGCKFVRGANPCAYVIMV